ncbi:1,4-dihydroxy-2-naphthoate octaprenyltransferase [Blattabacterium cuenoti]|uniref:1,4-dihydroxy-2-naphthoate octaprenyltransferase n=1 Tax=Blattabacterium cuenoti TaxID=1653831 RepID=UPI00163CA10B|nr:1,4-dihydroxy-2-naphthoate octaprenyltransferase [Blattabacterium cuenoti]
MKLKYWIYLSRIHTIPLSLSGLTSIFLHIYNKVYFNDKIIYIYILCIITAVLLQILSNISNDYGDNKKGLDRLFFIRKKVISSGLISDVHIKYSIYILSILSFLSGIMLIYVSILLTSLNNLYSFIYLLGLILCIYTSISYSLGINYGYIIGISDLLVLIFFGFVPIIFSYFLYTHLFPTVDIIFLSLSIGLFNASVLNINNMRDMDYDLLCKKKTLATYLGPKYIKLYHTIIILTAITLGYIFLFINKKKNYQFILLNIILLFTIKHIINIYLLFNNKNKNSLFTLELKKLVLIIFIYGLIIGI